MLKDLGRTCIEGRVIQRVFIAAICSLTLVGFGARSQDSVPEPAGYRVEAAVAIGKPGDKAQLPEALQARETPSQRNPISATVFEGSFGG